MNKMLLTPRWLIPAAVFALLFTLLVGGSVRAQTATAPAAPAIESLTPSDRAITVVWTAPASNDGSDITSYDLRHIGSDATDRADDNWTVEDDVWSSGALQATITGLTNGASYDVQARAVNDAGNGSWSATVSGKAATVPSAPYLGYAVAGNRQIRIAWSRPDSDGGSDITSYDLRYIRSDADDSVDANWTLKEDFSQSASFYSILGLTNGVAYHMQVRAINAAGDGAWSERVTRTPKGSPGTPSIDTVTPSDESLTITWSPPRLQWGRRSNRLQPPVQTRPSGLRILCLDLRKRHLDLRRPGVHLQRADQRRSVQVGPAGGQFQGLQRMVRRERSTHRHSRRPPGVTRRAHHFPGDFERNGGGHQLVSAGRRRRRRHHQLRSAPHPQRRGRQGRRQLDRPGERLELRRTEVHGRRTDRRDPVRLPAEGGQLRRSGVLVRHCQKRGPVPPGAPTFGESSEDTPGRLWVSWDPSGDDGGAPVTHYDLRYIRSDAEDKADANWTQVDDLTEEDYWIVGLTSGVRYDVQVRAANRAGDGSWSGTVTASPRPPRPNPPGNISATPGDGTLTVRWSAAPAKSGVTVAGYKVSYIRTDHPGIANFDNWTTTGRIASGTLEYTITALVNGVTYAIDAYSISARGRTSPAPGRRPTDKFPRQGPGRSGRAEMGLDPREQHRHLVDRPLGQRRAHRNLIRHPLPSHERSHERRQAFGARPGHHCRAWGRETNTWVGNLRPHVEYRIQVRARNRIGAGPWSSLTLIPRKKPVELRLDSLTPGDGALTLSWTDGDDDEITGYEVRYSHRRYADYVLPDSTDWDYIRGITGTSPLEYTITGLVNGRWYQVQVRGRNRYGELSSDFSIWSNAVPGTPRTTPDAPAIGSVTPGDRMLTVAWSAPAEDGGANITAYDLRYIRSDAPNKSDDNWTERDSVWTSGALRYVLSGLTNGVAYEVQVRAVNAVGAGPWSPVGTGTPETTPGMPSIGSVTPGDETLAVAWSAPASNGGRDITSYDLRYIRSDAPNKADANWTERDGIWSSGALRHVLSGLTNGVDYDVQLRAENAVGNGSWSGTGAGKPLTTPSAPTIDSVTPGDETLTVSWSAPSDTGGSEVTGYDLRYIRSDSPSKADANWTERDDVWSSGALQYTLSGLTNGIGYDLQVRGVNEAGDGRWSGAISGAPQTIPAAPTIASLTPGDETLTIAWSAPADTGGSTVEGYDARYIRSDAADKSDANWTERDGIWDVRRPGVHPVRPGQRGPVRRAAARGHERRERPLVRPDLRHSADCSRRADHQPNHRRRRRVGRVVVRPYGYRRVGCHVLRRALHTQRRPGQGRRPLDGAGRHLDLRRPAVHRRQPDQRGRVRRAGACGQRSRGRSLVRHLLSHAPDGNRRPGRQPDHPRRRRPRRVVVRPFGHRRVVYHVIRPALHPQRRPGQGRRQMDGKDGIWTSGDLEYTLSGLTNGVGYDVQVRAVNDAGNGPWSAIATDTPRTMPGAPAIDVVSPGNYALSITWSAPADDGGSAITSYDLRYIRSDVTDKADDNWTVREDIWSSGLLQYGLNESTGFNLSGGVRYDVQVRAVNAVGNGSWSASETGTPRSPSQPVTVPGAPASLLVTPGDGSLSIAWSAPADDGGADVTSYDLRYIASDAADKADDSWTVEEDVWSSGALEYTITGLTNGDRYDVQVRAVNEAGNGPWSATAAGIQVGSTSNVPPEFTEGDSATRSVSENATSGAAVGDPVAATDADNATLTYTLEGDDAGSFVIDAGTGQLTVGDGTTLDYEARASYAVSVRATNPSGYSAAIAVTIMVTDDDLGVIGSRYDANNDRVIDKAEVIKAINDYLFGEGDEAISKADVITLINAYLFD